MRKIDFFKISIVLLPAFVSTVMPTLLAADDIKIINLQKSGAKTKIAIKDGQQRVEQTVAAETKQAEVTEPSLKVLYKTFNLTPEAALVVAQAAMKNCRDSGYQVSVAVLDRGGNIQVVLRDRLAGITTPDIATLKAKTALGFKSSTSSLVNAIQDNKHLQAVTDIPGILILAGGITIEAAGSIIGSIGVSGAPDSKFDERCAIIGLKPIQGMLEFAE